MKKVGNLKKYMPWICLTLAFVGSMSMVAIYGNAYLDSDQAAELILGKMLSEDGGLLSENWYYSTSLRVFDINVFLKLGFLLSPDNWALARIIGQSFVVLTFIAAYIYAGSAFGTIEGTVYSAAALICPFGFWYHFHVVMMGIYYPYMILTLIGFGSNLRLLHCEKKYHIYI